MNDLTPRLPASQEECISADRTNERGVQNSAVYDLRTAVNEEYHLPPWRALTLTGMASYLRLLMAFRWTAIPYQTKANLRSLAVEFQEHKPAFETVDRAPGWAKLVASLIRPEALLYFSMRSLIDDIEAHLWHDYYTAAAVQTLHLAAPNEEETLEPLEGDDEIVPLCVRKP